MPVLKQIVRGQLHPECYIKLGFLYLGSGRGDICSDSLILPCVSCVPSFPRTHHLHVSVFIGTCGACLCQCFPCALASYLVEA